MSGRNGTAANGQRAWYDHEAEQQLLCELVIYPHYLDEILALVRPEDFSAPGGNQYQALIELTRTHGRISPYLLAQHPLVENPDWGKELDRRMPVGAARPYAKHLAVLARRRRAAQAGETLKAAAAGGDDAAIDQLLADLAGAVQSPNGEIRRPIDVDELLAEDDIEYDWLIPGLLERGDRLILTGGEGDGKSTLLRQLGMRSASGQHPFTGEPIDPVRTLVVDCENSRRQVRRAIAKTRDAATSYQAGHLRFECRPQGIDLLDPADQAWLNQLINANTPDVLMIGPLYKLAAGDPVKEETAREIANCIDSLRARTGITLVMEAHTPYADGHRAKRPIRPYGASLWSRWPEFGICLTKTGALEHWRGPREERAWPAALERSQPWPWAPRDDITPTWTGPTDCMALVTKLFAEHPDLELARSAIAGQIKMIYDKGFRDKTIREAADRLALDGILATRAGKRGTYFRLSSDGDIASTELELEPF